MGDPIVHFELPADNLERAQAFYKNTFGWVVQPMPEFEYTMLGTAPSNEQGTPTQPGMINGGMGKRGGPLSAPVVTILVGSIDAALQNVVKNGGQVKQARQPIGEMGFTAYFSDPEGNVVGLFEAPPAP
jgi:hypothetical protein